MPDNHDSAYLLCHNFIIPWKPRSTHTIDLEKTRHGSTHLPKNRGRHAQCRLRFFPPNRLTRTRSRSRTRDTPAPRRYRALPPAPRRAAHSRVPTSPTPLQRPHRLCRLGARAFSAATVRVDDELPQPTPSPSLLNTAAALLAYKRSKAMTSPVTSSSTPSRFAPLAGPLLTSPAHSRDEAPIVDPLPRAVLRQGEMVGSSPDH